MTFFRAFGTIKNVKVSEESHSACIRFEREQDALKFIQNKTLVFNRSYIIYDTNEDI